MLPPINIIKKIKKNYEWDFSSIIHSELSKSIDCMIMIIIKLIHKQIINGARCIIKYFKKRKSIFNHLER